MIIVCQIYIISHINIVTDKDTSIWEIAESMKEVVGIKVNQSSI
jgi:hypothetical protein